MTMEDLKTELMKLRQINRMRPANYTAMRCGAAEKPDLHARCGKNRGWMTGLRTKRPCAGAAIADAAFPLY